MPAAALQRCCRSKKSTLSFLNILNMGLETNLVFETISSNHDFSANLGASAKVEGTFNHLPASHRPGIQGRG